ncbi:hypothetical protein ACFPRL_17730 [Pseudoclavibacter helvolus]
MRRRRGTRRRRRHRAVRRRGGGGRRRLRRSPVGGGSRSTGTARCHSSENRTPHCNAVVSRGRRCRACQPTSHEGRRLVV